MSSATLRLHARALHRKITVVHAIKIHWKLVYAIAVLLAVAMLIFYIAIINQLTSGAFLIKNYNKQIASLTQENSSLQANFAESTFLGQTFDQAMAMGFQKTTKVAYVQVMQGAVAKAK